MQADNPHWPRPLLGAIVAMNRDNVIGVHGGIPWHYRTDMQRFKRQTVNTVVIMGRLTWASIGGKPLAQRRNIVISRSRIAGAECYPRVDQALKKYHAHNIWIIGGGQLYRACFADLNFLDVTRVPDRVEAANAVTFPQIQPDVWQPCRQCVIDAENHLINLQYIRRTWPGDADTGGPPAGGFPD